MKRISLFITAVTSAVISCAALAAEGTINFTGSIIDTACTVDAASANQTVKLGTVAASSFSSAGATAGVARFSINLTGCPAAAKTASVRFDGPVPSGNSSVLSLSSGQSHQFSRGAVPAGQHAPHLYWQLNAICATHYIDSVKLDRASLYSCVGVVADWHLVTPAQGRSLWRICRAGTGRTLC